MKYIICMIAVMALLASPAFAARVYLKEGGYIQAKKVWRTPGRVHVLVNRDTLTVFETREIDLKRTFPVRKRVVRRPVTHLQAATPAPKGAQPPAEKRSGVSLPNMPAPSPAGTAEEGTIRKHKREMQEKANE